MKQNKEVGVKYVYIILFDFVDLQPIHLYFLY